MSHKPRNHVFNKRSPKSQMFQKHKDWPDIIYGKNPIVEVLKVGKREVIEILSADDPQRHAELEVYKLANKSQVPVKHTKVQELNHLTHNGVHQNIVARVKPYPEYQLREVFENSETKNLVLVLDCVQDPQNFGTICRSAMAFGVKEVIIPKDRSAPISGVVCKASAGAVEHLKVIKVTNLVRALEELKKHDYWVYGASLDDISESLQKVSPAHKTALVLGSEGKGLRRLVAETCDQLVKIPMAGGFDSLNVAQAGTVLLYDFSQKIGINV